MKIILLILCISLVGGGIYLCFDKDMREKTVKYVDEITNKINEDALKSLGKTPTPVKIKRDRKLRRVHSETAKENINKTTDDKSAATTSEAEHIAENNNVLDNKPTDAVQKAEAAGNFKKPAQSNINKEKEVTLKKARIISKETNKENTNSYIAMIKGKARVIHNHPDRISVDGNIIRLYGVSPINYAYAEREIKMIAEGKEVNCGIIKYSSNKTPYAVCFTPDEVNINYHLIDSGYAVYKNN